MLCRKATNLFVIPAKAGIQSQNIKSGFPLEFTPHSMRGGNDRKQTNAFLQSKVKIAEF